MLLLALVVLILLGTLLILRAGRDSVAEPWATREPFCAALWGALAVVLGNFPLFFLAPGTGGKVLYFGDAMGHARVAAEIAQHGLPHGWLETFVGGFPAGHHYPAMGWLLVAALIKAGFSSAVAAHAVGFLATLAAPLSLYAAAIWAGARLPFAVLGALFLAWVSPYNPFVGGYEAFFRVGLLSQVIALPCCILLLGFVARGGSHWPGVITATLAMACHPQLTVATFAVLTPAALVAARGEPLKRCLRAALAAAVAGAAVYGQGLSSLNIPLGWPPALGWKQLGFSAARLNWWIQDGDLLDNARVMVLTPLLLACLLVLLLRLNRPAARSALCACLLAVLFSVSGHAIAALGNLGHLLLTFLQPLRVVALIPVVGGIVVVAALQEGVPLVSKALPRFQFTRIARALPWGISGGVLAIMALALPSRIQRAKHLANDNACHSVAGYDRGTVAHWLGSLEGGRLAIAPGKDPKFLNCRVNEGLDHESAVPLGWNSVGGHVGMLLLAFERLDLEREGSAKRAQALGIQHVLRLNDGTPVLGWRISKQHGGLELLTHDPAGVLIAAGCIRKRWSGTDRALRAHLTQQLLTDPGADAVLDPSSWVELVNTPGVLSITELSGDACNSNDATVSARAREPGAYEATVQSSAPVDVAFRATAFPSWKVKIDGIAATPQRIAPGFFSVRVPAGRHQVIATAGPLPGYLGWIVGALIVNACIAAAKRRHLVRLRAVLRLGSAAKQATHP